MAKRKQKKKRSQNHPKRRETKQETTSTHTATNNPNTVFRWLAGLAVIGLLLTAYLTWAKWFGDHPAFCSDDSACDLVQSSRWSTLFGLPLSFWGMTFYGTLIATILRIRPSGHGWPLAWTIAGFGFVLSVYLTLISVIEIEATCPYCLASAVISTVIFFWLTALRVKNLPGFDWPNTAILRLGISVFLVALFHFHHAGVFDPRAGPEKFEVVALIEHLKSKKAVFYGAYWCPRCQQQKELFGASVKKLPYVECAPNGRDGLRAPVCQAKGIQSYPTWIINDKTYTGLMSLKELASVSGYSGALP